MLIQILRQVMISGEPALAGSTLDLPPTTAFMLISSGKATPAEAAEVVEPEAVEAPEPAPVPKATRARTKPSTQPLED